MREYKQFYINGQWVDPVTPNDFDVINPATEEVMTMLPPPRARMAGIPCLSPRNTPLTLTR